MRQLGLVFLISFICGHICFSQTFQKLDIEIEVNGAVLNNGLAGGLNAPQLSEVDLNNDQISDLYIFDRSGNVHLTFLNAGTQENPNYKLDSKYSRNFPTDVGNFVALRDYDQDGIMDLFGHGNIQNSPLSVKVYKGFYQNDKINFERILFDESDFLHYTDGGGNTRIIEFPESDYPAFLDVDDDGDLDILTFDFEGSHVIFFQNQSQEQGFGNEKLIFILKDDCWGRFLEDMTSPDLILSDDANLCATGFTGNQVDDRENIHPGSTLLAFDANNDGKKDLALGDISSSNITLLYNTGSNETAWITDQNGAYPFPQSDSIRIPDFPATFLLDLDGDNVKDLVACPSKITQTPDIETIWFFKNTGSNEIPEFQLIQKDFLGNEMIDLGTDSNPTFADVNADGLLDMVVGNTTSYIGNGVEKDSRLFLFENTGTPTEPKFELIDDNWLNFRQFSQIPAPNGTFGFAPTFGDLDGDGDEDLLVGEEEGKLFFVRNNAGAGNPMTFDFPQFGWQGIDEGTYSKPQIVDLNRDNLPDIVLGKSQQKVRYFQNQGTTTNPQFDPNDQNPPNNSDLGGMIAPPKLSGAVNSIGFAAPVVLDFGNAFNIVLGSDRGDIRLYNNIENNLDGEFNLAKSNFGNVREGFRTSPALADLDGDGIYEMAVGNIRGGISIYKTNLHVDGTTNITSIENQIGIDVSPNPFSEFIKLSFSNLSSTAGTYTIFNAIGQEVEKGHLLSRQNTLILSHLNSGIYFLNIVIDDITVTKKIIKN